MSPADEFSRELRNTRGPGSDTGSGRRVTGRETRKIRRMSTHEVWLRNFEQVADAIPESWRVTDPDGLQWIRAEHATAPIVGLHRQLCLVGFANGWL